MFYQVNKKRLLSLVSSGLVSLVFVFTTLVSSDVLAQSERKTKRVQTVSAQNAKKFEQVSTLFEANKTSEAKAILDTLSSGKTKLNNFEKAYLANFLGAYYFDKDQLDRALREYKKILITPDGIPTGFYTQTYYTIAQIYFSKEDYKSALDYAQRWFKTTEDPPADAYMLVGQAHYMLKNYNKALPNVQKGIQKYVDVGSTPKEGWLNLLSSIYQQKGDYKRMRPVVQQLNIFYPKKSYLVTLAGVDNELNAQNKMAAIYSALYDQGLLSTESELITLASLLISEDNPYKAAKIVEKGMADGIVKKNMKNYQLYSQSLLIAKEYEKALNPLEKAASLSGDGKLYSQLGQSYVALYRWKEAESAFNKAINKGKLTNAGNTHISKGLAQYELKKFKSAKSSFQAALKYEKSAKDAGNWIKYIDAEVARIKELEKPVVIDVNISAG